MCPCKVSHFPTEEDFTPASPPPPALKPRKAGSQAMAWGTLNLGGKTGL